MNYLFLDTSSNLTIGILNKKFQWLDLIEIETKKTSEIIHSQIFEILTKNNLSVSSDFEIISIVGPGSYTGMRIVEGVNQIFELEAKKVYSFHSFYIPQFMNLDWDYICFMAFKNEVYVYDKAHKGQLIAADNFKLNFIDNDSLKLVTFGDGLKALSSFVLDIRADFLKNPFSTLELVTKNNLRHEPFYFRPVEVEFKQNS